MSPGKVWPSLPFGQTNKKISVTVVREDPCGFSAQKYFVFKDCRPHAKILTQAGRFLISHSVVAVRRVSAVAGVLVSSWEGIGWDTEHVQKLHTTLSLVQIYAKSD